MDIQDSLQFYIKTDFHIVTIIVYMHSWISFSDCSNRKNTRLSRLQVHKLLNPLSPNIHIQILLTDLHIFP